APQESSVLVGGMFEQRVFAFADVDAEACRRRSLARRGLLQMSQQFIHTVVGEAHAVDERARSRYAVNAWSRVARLRVQGDRADLDVAEAERAEAAQRNRVLAVARGQPNRVLEAQPERAHRQATVVHAV